MMTSPPFADKHAIADAVIGNDEAIAESLSEDSGRFDSTSIVVYVGRNEYLLRQSKTT